MKWSGGPNAGPDVAWARQSLAPIVWNGQLNPQLNDNPNSPQWGYTLGGVTRVWRTGVGIDRRGNLIFVAADDQTVITIAKILQHVGAVRAMEFDINPEWHTLITYTHGPTVSSRRWSGPTRSSRPTAISSPTTVTSSPSTAAYPVRSLSPSSRRRGCPRRWARSRVTVRFAAGGSVNEQAVRLIAPAAPATAVTVRSCTGSSWTPAEPVASVHAVGDERPRQSDGSCARD